MKYSLLHNTAVTKKWTPTGLISRMIFSELCKIMVKKVTFVGFRGGATNRPPWIRPCFLLIFCLMFSTFSWYLWLATAASCFSEQ